MQEQQFIYKGKELAPELRRVIARDKEKSIVISHKIADLKSLNTNKDIFDHRGQELRSKMKEDADVNQLNKLRGLAEGSVKKATLWLKECERKPRREFTLDFTDLDWLYHH